MKVFIKECLYVLDYKNRILECIFNSDNHDRAGYAYEVNVQDTNTGYSDLNFKMPREIIDRNGKKILNPKLAFLKPLTKIRYTRQVRYIDEEDLRVVNPDGTIDIYHHNDYLKDFMTGKTKYVMDYIIQPLNKNRSSIKIDLSYTAIDFPRYNLSKKKVGLTFDNTTLTTKELSLYKNKPLNTPGYATYIPWTSNEVGAFQLGNAVNSVDKLGSNVKPVKGDVWNVTSSGSTGGLYQYDGFQWNKLNNSNDLLSWSPNAQSGSYPLTEAAIKKLVEQTTFSNGILSTIYYWPVTETGRYQGVLYEKGDFITLSLYNTYEGLEYEGSEYLNSITWEWGHLDKIQPYLSPNTACHYLRYILQNTNWKVKGDKDLFIAHEGARPYFINDEVPENPSEGQYYIKGILSGDTSTGYEFQTEVYRWEDGRWRNKTEESFGQVVNMAATVDALGTVTADEDFGTLYDIDIEQVEVARSAQASVGEKVLTDARYSLNASNSNCYNAITAEAKTFDLYPVFDCETNTVSLKLNAGAQYGLKYRYGYNLKSSTVKEDGDKVITKLYGTGGVDAQGSANINIGNATRSISGIAPDLVSNRAEHYDKALIQSLMTDLQQNAYNNMVGAPLTTSLNMNGVKFKLSFPDNFYEKAYDFSSQPSSAAVQLISFSSGRSIYMRYNPTGSDHCFYVYDGANPDDYTDETKQLYKYDYSNKALRRNKETYVSNNIGVINSISNRATAIGSLPIVGTYMKYTTPLDEDIQLIKTTYKSSCLDMTINDYSYEINTSLDNNFVLVGPNRIYTVFDNEKTFTTYSLGNYYYFIDENKYAYCFDKVTEAKKNGASSIYNNINKISITGYAFIVIGEPTDLLYIEVNGNRTKVRDKNGEYITLQQWLSNNYAIRVEWDGAELVEYERDEFDPNADEYLIGRSPYGTNYVYNFKYLYDNGWMTKEDILDIYRVNKIINNINLDFYNKYTQELINLQAKYDDARANNEVYSTKADAQLEALMSNYWINPDAASKGEFSAFPGVPKFSDGGSASDHLNQTNHMYWEKITYPEDPDFEHIVYFNIFGLPGTQYLYPQATNSGIIANNPHNEGQYHTTVKSLGWDDYVTNKLAINEELNGGYTESQNPSGQVENYNEFIKKMKEYYYRAKVSEKAIQEAADDLEALAEETKAWEQTINGYERYIQENYGQYIIEGSYANSEQPYPNLLFDEMVKKSSSNSEIGVSEKFATPNVTYSVNVVDSSGLFEYRNPGKGECNDLIKKLHSLGQIVPRAGDYVSIYDAPMGMYGVPGLITTITRRLDDPLQNNITIDTSYTDAEELVGNIITATNTVLNNKDVYGRAAIINNKGELSATTVSNALSSGTDSINIVSTNGKVNVNDNGLTCTNPGDVANVIRYNGTGILASSNGGVTWRELMTPNGINANYINAGSINASNVSITDGQYDITSLTSDGLAVKSVPGDSYSIGTFNASTGAANSDWENLTVFVGKDKNGQGVGYFNGYINASKGGNIGGWSILSSGLAYGGTLPNSPDYYLGPTGTNATINGENRNYILKVGSNFGVDTSGNLVATSSGTSKIGPWTITDDAYYNGKSSLSDDSNGVYLGIDGIALGANNVFKVTNAGVLTATSGKIADWSITKDYLGARTSSQTAGNVDKNYFLSQGGQYAYCTMNGGNHDNFFVFLKDKFAVTTEGKLYAKGATISGAITATSGSFTGSIHTTSGEIGGLTISESGLSNANASIQKDGAANFHPQVKNGGDYVFNDGMTLHSTAAQTIESGSSLNLGSGDTPSIIIKSTSKGSVEIYASNLRISADDMSIGNSYSGARSTALTTTITIPASGSIAGQTLKFINGILVK